MTIKELIHHLQNPVFDPDMEVYVYLGGDVDRHVNIRYVGLDPLAEGIDNKWDRNEYKKVVTIAAKDVE